MSIWRDHAGNGVVVCDTCGITENGWFIYDATGFTQVDLTAEILKAGAPAGTGLEVTDCCPDCEARIRER